MLAEGFVRVVEVSTQGEDVDREGKECWIRNRDLGVMYYQTSKATGHVGTIT